MKLIKRQKALRNAQLAAQAAGQALKSAEAKAAAAKTAAAAARKKQKEARAAARAARKAARQAKTVLAEARETASRAQARLAKAEKKAAKARKKMSATTALQANSKHPAPPAPKTARKAAPRKRAIARRPQPQPQPKPLLQTKPQKPIAQKPIATKPAPIVRPSRITSVRPVPSPAKVIAKTSGKEKEIHVPRDFERPAAAMPEFKTPSVSESDADGRGEPLSN